MCGVCVWCVCMCVVCVCVVCVCMCVVCVCMCGVCVCVCSLDYIQVYIAHTLLSVTSMFLGESGYVAVWYYVYQLAIFS